MIEAKQNLKIKRNLDATLMGEYAKALNNPKFKALVNNLKIPENIALKYTSRLEESTAELTNCKECQGIINCKNKLEGHVSMPSLKGRILVFSYTPCKYKKAATKNEENLVKKNNLTKASFKEIDITDKKRSKLIKALKEFYDKYDKNEKMKGMYIHGSFGSGKSYLVAALFNELSKKRVRCESVYFPELIRNLKSDFDTYGEKLEYLQHVDLLLVDDIGAEKVTEWSRDEVLGTILQFRMDNNLPTFFTSNLSITELESHLNTGIGSDNLIKARRITERIKQLTIDYELISENRRK